MSKKMKKQGKAVSQNSDKKSLRQWVARHRKILIFGSPIIVCLFMMTCADIISYVQTRNTPAEVQEAYKSIQENGRRVSVEKELIASKVVSQKIGETERSVCYIASGGSMLTVSYSQVCYVRTTVGFYTDMSKDQAIEQLQYNTSDELFRDIGSLKNRPENCHLSSSDSPIGVRYVIASTPPSYINDFMYLEYEKCGRPSPDIGLLNTSGRALGTNLSIKPIKNIPSNEIDMSRSQIWIEDVNEYFHQPLSCQPLPVRLLGSCHLSREEPVQ